MTNQGIQHDQNTRYILPLVAKMLDDIYQKKMG